MDGTVKIQPLCTLVTIANTHIVTTRIHTHIYTHTYTHTNKHSHTHTQTNTHSLRKPRKERVGAEVLHAIIPENSTGGGRNPPKNCGTAFPSILLR